jgi:hypothetical protein
VRYGVYFLTLKSNIMSYLNTEETVKNYVTSKEFPTLRDYCLYVCGGDFTAFDDYNSLAQYMLKDELGKGIPHI